jgi:hypothetical protein
MRQIQYRWYLMSQTRSVLDKFYQRTNKENCTNKRECGEVWRTAAQDIKRNSKNCPKEFYRSCESPDD